MKAFLLYRDRDLDPAADLPLNEAALRQDLELDRLFSAMAAGDPFLFEVAKQVVMTSLGKPEPIVYRQDILTDCLAQPKVTREIYDLAVEAIAGERGAHHWLYARSADGLLSESIKVLELFVSMLRRLRHIAEQHALAFHSEGFTRLFATLARELGDEYLEEVEAHLARLRFRDGIRISADLGTGNKGIDYVLRRSPDPSQSRLRRLFARDRSGYVYEIAERDEAGFQALSELRGRGTSLVASALGRSMSDILSFFAMLRSELGFYVGCLNLSERLSAKGEPICFPEPVPAGRPILAGRGLYDVCLSLSVAERVVGNDMSADGKSLVMITGANRGGKSTFLRSIGLAQLMLQCGMFVTAESFRADVRAGIFTHFRREEDASMRRGKLDEGLPRFSKGHGRPIARIGLASFAPPRCRSTSRTHTDADAA